MLNVTYIQLAFYDLLLYQRKSLWAMENNECLKYGSNCYVALVKIHWIRISHEIMCSVFERVKTILHVYEAQNLTKNVICYWGLIKTQKLYLRREVKRVINANLGVALLALGGSEGVGLKGNTRGDFGTGNLLILLCVQAQRLVA